MKREAVFVLVLVTVAIVALSAVPAAGVNMTLSDAGLMTLDWYGQRGNTTASIIGQRNLPGPGVEFDIYFPGNEHPDRSVYYFSSKWGGNGSLVGIDVSMYDAFELKYTLVSVDGINSPDAGGYLVVGAYFNNAYRPEVVSFDPGRETAAISTTRIAMDQIHQIGIHAHMLTPAGWNPSGTTVTLLVEPAPGAVAIPKSAVAVPEPAETNYYYVDASATGNNDGSSWANAYKYLQDALDAASKADQIWVAQGVYKPDQGSKVKAGDRSATFQLKSGVAIYGGFPTGGSKWKDSNPNAYETILSGDLKADDAEVNTPAELLGEPTRAENSYHVVTGSGTDEAATLDGFTITGGNANGPQKNNYNRGGGMHNKSGSPILINCTFSKNSAEYGGGIYNSGGNPALTNCRFTGNWARDSGGGMHNSKSNPTLTNCIFVRNSAREKGGGMHNEHNTPTLTNCTFSRNSAYAGGGIYNHKSSPMLANCILWGNSSRYGTGEPAQIYGVRIIANHCCVQGLTDSLGGTGNIGLDPLFVDINNDSHHLQPDSPCIDSGNNAAVPPQAVVDIDGNPRLIDGNGDSSITVDMGAYEYGR